MLVSIITVVFNAVDTIEDTIKSVLSQSYTNVDFIIVDGGSTDGTVDIIKKYDQSIRWLSEPDSGIYNALNKGVKLAKGDRLLFLGADDTLNNVIHKIAPYFNEPNTIYYGNAFMLRSQIYYAGNFNALKIAHQNICHQSIFYPKCVFDDYSYNEQNRVHADYELNLLLYSNKKYKFEFINEVISNYSEQGFSTRTVETFYSRQRLELVKKYFPYYVYAYALLRHISTKYIKKILRK